MKYFCKLGPGEPIKGVCGALSLQQIFASWGSSVPLLSLTGARVGRLDLLFSLISESGFLCRVPKVVEGGKKSQVARLQLL